MKITLELSTVVDVTSKVGTSYKVSDVKFDTILDKKLTAEEDAKYAAMAKAMAEYYRELSIVLEPAIKI